MVQDTIRSLRFGGPHPDIKPSPLFSEFADLAAPKSPFDEAYDQLVGYSRLRWLATAGAAMRPVALGDALAGGANDAILEQWVNDRFPVMCRQHGDDGMKLLKIIKKYGNTSRLLVQDLDRFLQRHAELSELTVSERLALALLVIDRFGPKE